MRNPQLRQWFLVMLLITLAACSGSSDSDVGLIGAESLYDPGASVGAVGYSEAYGIELYLLNEDGRRILLSDGDYVEPGTRTIGVRIDGDPANVDRILLSDGGVYQVGTDRELWEDGLYVASFDVTQENLYQNILVQVIHLSGLASKEKIVLRTFEHEYDDHFIKNSVGLLVGNDVLSDLRESLADMMDEMFQEAISNIAGQGSGVITEIGYGDSDPSTTDVVITSLRAENNESYPRSVLHISLIIKDVNFSACSLYGQNLIATSDNDLAVSCYLAIEDEGEDGSIRVILDLSDSAQVKFEQEFFLKDVVEELLLTQLTKIELPCLVSDLAGLGDGLSYDLAEYILFYGKELDSETFLDVEDSGMFDKFLFVDAYGIPEDTNEEALGLGLGLHSVDYEDVAWNRYENPDPDAEGIDFEAVFEEMFEDMIDDEFEKMRQDYAGLISELSFGDGNPDTPDLSVNSFVLENTADVGTKNGYISFTIKEVDLHALELLGIPLISTDDNDLTIDAVFSMGNVSVDGNDFLVMDIVEVADVSFSDYFSGDLTGIKRETVESIIKSDLESMDQTSVAVNEMIPDEVFDMNFSSGFDPGCEVPLFPDVQPFITGSSWDLVLTENFNIASAISQDSINLLIENIFTEDRQWNVNELLVDLLGEDFEGFSSDTSADKRTIMRLSVPPVIDLRASQMRICINDMILQYMIKDTPQWEASVDIDIIVEPRVNSNSIDIYLTPIEQDCHFHIMRDNPGNLGIFDHSSLVSDVFESVPDMVGGSPDDPSITIDIDIFSPTIVFSKTDSPLSISSGNGYLYLNMDISILDLSGASPWEKRCE